MIEYTGLLHDETQRRKKIAARTANKNYTTCGREFWGW
jgi:hypothetical protein